MAEKLFKMNITSRDVTAFGLGMATEAIFHPIETIMGGIRQTEMAVGIKDYLKWKQDQPEEYQKWLEDYNRRQAEGD